jgi:hypothetical protein
MTSFKFLHSDVQKLYHVVFGNDFHDVSILDNMLEPVVDGTLRLSSPDVLTSLKAFQTGVVIC